MHSRPEKVTQLLLAWSEGDRGALDRLIPLVHDELHRLACRYMEGERSGHVLQPTALVNEAYLRLVECQKVRWQNRAQFFGISAQLMRRVLVDFARAGRLKKRGGGAIFVSFREELLSSPGPGPELVALDDALKALAALDARKSNVVELRFFGGLSVEETAAAMEVSRETVLRDWKLAKAWLLRELKREKVT